MEELARRWFEIWSQRDFEALGALYADDAEWIRADGVSVGPNEIVDYARAIATAFPDEKATIDAVLVSDGAVVVEWRESATHTGPRETPVGTIPPTGRAFHDLRAVEVFRFRDGKIVSQHEYYDLYTVLRQLGWLELLAQR